MAKRKVAIFLTVDDEPTQEPSDMEPITEEENKFPSADETYAVHIRNTEREAVKDVMVCQSMLTAAAHEFGHVLAKVFKHPVDAQDPRTDGPGKLKGCCLEHAGADAEEADRVRAGEKLAWDIGREIKPDLDQNIAKAALESYGKQGTPMEAQKSKGPTPEQIQALLGHIERLLTRSKEKEQAEEAVKTLQPA